MSGTVKLSRRTPKGWKRKAANAEQIAEFHKAASPILAKGEITECAIWYDRSGQWRRVDGAYASGHIVSLRRAKNGHLTIHERGAT